MTVTSVQSISAQALRITFTSPSAPAPERPRSDSKAERLMAALDADGDGAVSKDEFTTGAQALLRQAGARRRAEGHDEARGEAHGLRRLERKLERVFERVDANDDGAVDADELKTALASSRRGGRGRGPREDDAPAVEPQPSAGAQSGVTIQVTVVAVALQRYTSVQKDGQQAEPTDVLTEKAPPAHPLPPAEVEAAQHDAAPPAAAAPLHDAAPSEAPAAHDPAPTEVSAPAPETAASETPAHEPEPGQPPVHA